MKTFISKISIMCLFLFLFQNCQNYAGEKKQNQPLTKLTNLNTLKSEIKEEKNIYYSIKVEVIDSAKYNSVKQNCKVRENNMIKITDFDEVKRLLKGTVEFEEENQAVRKIHFRNGKKYTELSDYDYSFFIAYFPEEDILLCEGGHSTDISFNLKNGNETEETGNPDLFLFSPNKKYRLSGSYDGQECNGYFIQVSKKEDFEKIINLEEEVKRETNISICNIRDGFWTNDNTLYLEKYDFDYEYNKYKYLKIQIIEKTTPNT